MFLLRAFHYDVIDIYQNIPANLRAENLGSHYVEASFSILEPLRHPKVTIYTTGGDEAGFSLIFFLHPDLMIA